MSSHIIMSNDNGASSLSASPAPEFEALDFAGWP